MPPEQLPWDRREFRKHERSTSDTRFVSGGGGGFGGRWRDHHHPHVPPPPSPHPPPYHHHQNPQQPQRWYSDFRSSRTIQNGHGRQGGWHTYKDENGHGFPQFGSRHNDRNFEDDGSRPLGFRGDGRYIRSSRESRGVFSHKEWRSPNWEMSAGSSGPGKHTEEVVSQKPQENTSCNNNQSKNGDAAIPVTVLPLDQHKSDSKENYEDGGDSEGVTGSSQNNAPSSNLEKTLVELNSHKPVENVSLCYSNSKFDDMVCAITVFPLDQHPPVLNEKHEDCWGADAVTRSIQRFEKENTLGSIDRRFLKWSRSVSLSSRYPSFGNSSSSKGDEVHHTENGMDVRPESMMPVDSSSAGAYAASIALNPSDNTNSKKKPRLGWGEGLAKYERKKVERPDNLPGKIDPFSIPHTETLHSPSGNLLDKSPILTSLPMSPTPSSVACSVSPGMEEQESNKTAGIDHINASTKTSLSILPEPDYKEPSFNLEGSDELSSVPNLSSLVNELLQPNDQALVETDYVKSTSMNKLLALKVNVLKALEVTESEIDLLEKQFRSLASDPSSCCPHPSVSGSSTEDCCINPCLKMVNPSSFTTEPSLLKPVVPDVNIGDATVRHEDELMLPMAEKNDSPLSNSSLSELSFRTSECIEHPSTDPTSFRNFDQMYCKNVDCVDDSIISSNKDVARKVTDDLNKLLASQWHSYDAPTSSHVSSFPRNPSDIKEKILMRRRAIQFSEKVLTVKYKLFQHFWKEGRVVSLKKIKGKSHKKFDLSQTTHSTNRASSHSRLLYSAGSVLTVPAEEIVDFVNDLLSKFPLKPCRSTLKMPSLILDRQRKNSRFISNNGLVHDPSAIERERSVLNPWTAEEREVFIDKLAAFGKDFRRIASFLDHRTIADCVEFYYKNHKSECFSRAKRKSDSHNKKFHPSMYLMGTGLRLYRDSNDVSLDILGEIANANSYLETQPNYKSQMSLGSSGYQKSPRGDEGTSQIPENVEFYANGTAAVDVLAGICGSLSSEAMSSCITTSADPADGNQYRKIQKQSLCIKRLLNPNATQCVDDECSEESYEEIDSADWTDEEKTMFIQAVSLYGKDFLMISRLMRTRSKDQCRIFFSKARKCLGLDLIQPSEAYIASEGIDGGGGGGVMGAISSFCNIASEGPFDNKPVKENQVSNGLEPNALVETAVVSSGIGSRPINKQDNSYFAESGNKITLKVSDRNHSKEKNGSCTSAEESKHGDAEKTGIASCKVPIISFASDSAMMTDENASQSDEKADANASSFMSVQKIGLSESMGSSSMLFPVPIKYQRNSCSGGDRQNVIPSMVDAVHTQRILQTTECLDRHSFPCHSKPSESSHIPEGYPVSVTTCEGIAWDGDNKTQITPDCGSEQVKQTPSDQHKVSSQQECDHSRHQNDASGQNGTHPTYQSSVSVNDDKPSRNGDLKLFGKVLVTHEDKPSSIQAEDNGKCLKQEPLNLNHGRGTEAGFPHPPDPTATSNSGQSLLHTIGKSSDCLPNGASVLSGQVLSRCNGLPGTNVLPPLATDTKLPQDVLWIGNGVHFKSRDASSGGRVIIGGQCSGVSNSIAAIKRHHYSTAQTVSVQAGNLVGDENGDAAR